MLLIKEADSGIVPLRFETRTVCSSCTILLLLFLADTCVLTVALSGLGLLCHYDSGRSLVFQVCIFRTCAAASRDARSQLVLYHFLLLSLAATCVLTVTILGLALLCHYDSWRSLAFQACIFRTCAAASRDAHS